MKIVLDGAKSVLKIGHVYRNGYNLIIIHRSHFVKGIIASEKYLRGLTAVENLRMLLKRGGGLEDVEARGFHCLM